MLGFEFTFLTELSNASITVFPVTKIESSETFSDNKLFLADKHFYSQNKNDRIKKTIYNNEESKMHVEFENIARVFKTYHLINSYAADSNIEILNLSTKTWIDAFKRK